MHRPIGWLVVEPGPEEQDIAFADGRYAIIKSLLNRPVGCINYTKKRSIPLPDLTRSPRKALAQFAVRSGIGVIDGIFMLRNQENVGTSGQNTTEDVSVHGIARTAVRVYVKH